MSRVLTWLGLAAALGSGCTQAFRFTDDGGAAPDAAAGGGAGDAGLTDAGCLLVGECECLADGACAGPRPRCGTDHRCVECLTSQDCGSNGLCDARTRRCTTACTSDSQCTVDARIKCEGDPPTRHCVGCDDDNPNCPPATPICARSVGYCVACDSDSACSAPAPRCDRRSGTCVRCLASSDCAAADYCTATTATCQPRP